MIAFVILDLVVCIRLGLLCVFVVVSHGLDVIFTVSAKKLSGNRIS